MDLVVIELLKAPIIIIPHPACGKWRRESKRGEGKKKKIFNMTEVKNQKHKTKQMDRLDFVPLPRLYFYKSMD
jgi:hypothetical protein